MQPIMINRVDEFFRNTDAICDAISVGIFAGACLIIILSIAEIVMIRIESKKKEEDN